MVNRGNRVRIVNAIGVTTFCQPVGVRFICDHRGIVHLPVKGTAVSARILFQGACGTIAISSVQTVATIVKYELLPLFLQKVVLIVDKFHDLTSILC